MNFPSARLSRSGFNLTALVVIIATLVILAALLLTTLAKTKKRSSKLGCVNLLKQTSLAFRIWASDNDDKMPMAVPVEKDGTMEFVTGADTFRHFQVMSNELSTPRILNCPYDTRAAATNFASLENRNVSYFVGLDAREEFPQRFLAGDRNLTGPSAPVNGILKLVPGDAVNWTTAIHNRYGNIALADGSVQSLSDSGLRTALKDSGESTNTWRISLPE